MASAQDDELTAIRAQRLQAMQDQLNQQAMTQLEAQEDAELAAAQSASMDVQLRQYLTPEARSRLARIGLVEPNRAQTIKATLVENFESGVFTAPMSDAALKQVLASLSKSRSNASIRRI
jgi:programmed cell death protein 5